MSREGQLPAEWKPDDDPIVSAGMHIAMQWRELGAEHLSAAMRAMEPELRREHKERLMRLEMQREEAARQHTEWQQRQAHVRHLVSLIVGAVMALAMLGGGIYVAPESWWLSILLCGPSLLALAKIFVLGRSDPDDMKHVSLAARTTTNAAGQAQPPQPPMA